MGRTLYRGGVVRTPDRPGATALLVDDARVAWVGGDTDAPTEAGEVVDLDGALVAPAFVDAHVHATSTGIALLGLDLTATTSLADCLDRVATAARAARGGVVQGHGWDETRWPEGRPPTRQELDRASYGGVVYLSRVDVHSAVVSSALLAAAPEATAAAGFQESGHLTRDAHHVVRKVARESISARQRRDLQRAALDRAAGLGVAAVHELAGPDISGVEDAGGLLALAAEEPGPEVVLYWGELGAAGIARAHELGALGAAGDLFADGSIGSHTAALLDPYADADHAGHAYLDAEQVGDHVVACTRAGLQAGFHAIGDAALSAVGAGLRAAETALGTDAVRAARHRVEHVEMVPAHTLQTFADLGVVASVQPLFDRLWGGREGMYAQRLGTERSLAANPFAALHSAGVVLAFGSDAPVTPIGPWAAVHAAADHHYPASSLGVDVAFAAHTRGGWAAARRDDVGDLRVGAPATLAVWDEAELDAATGLPGPTASPVCRRTVLAGRTIFDR